MSCVWSVNNWELLEACTNSNKPVSFDDVLIELPFIPWIPIHDISMEELNIAALFCHFPNNITLVPDKSRPLPAELCY